MCFLFVKGFSGLMMLGKMKNKIFFQKFIRIRPLRQTDLYGSIRSRCTIDFNADSTFAFDLGKGGFLSYNIFLSDFRAHASFKIWRGVKRF